MAVSSLLLEDSSIDGARVVLLNVISSDDMSVDEVHDAASIIHEAAHEVAQVIFGAATDEELGGELRVTLVASGIHHPVPAVGTKTPTGRGSQDTQIHGGVGESRQRLPGSDEEPRPPVGEFDASRLGFRPYVR